MIRANEISHAALAKARATIGAAASLAPPSSQAWLLWGWFRLLWWRLVMASLPLCLLDVPEARRLYPASPLAGRVFAHKNMSFK